MGAVLVELHMCSFEQTESVSAVTLEVQKAMNENMFVTYVSCCTLASGLLRHTVFHVDTN